MLQGPPVFHGPQGQDFKMPDFNFAVCFSKSPPALSAFPLCRRVRGLPLSLALRETSVVLTHMLQGPPVFHGPQGQDFKMPDFNFAVCFSKSPPALSAFPLCRRVRGLPLSLALRETSVVLTHMLQGPPVFHGPQGQRSGGNIHMDS